MPTLSDATTAPASRRATVENLFRWWVLPGAGTAPPATLLPRLMAGGVFLWEGILKFVYPSQGVGRFTKIGIPAPAPMASFVGIVEIVCGVLLILGLLTRLAAIPVIIDMLTAMLTTKIAIFRGTSPLPLPPVPPQTGFWAVLHEVRSEYAQLVTVLFVLIIGAGAWSMDAWLARGRAPTGGAAAVPHDAQASTIGGPAGD